MQKKKTPKIHKASHRHDEALEAAFIENMLDTFVENDPHEMQATAQLVSSVIGSAIDLSKLVIENRVRNSHNMVDKDIYEIYQNSFNSIFEVSKDLKD